MQIKIFYVVHNRVEIKKENVNMKGIFKDIIGIYMKSNIIHKMCNLNWNSVFKFIFPEEQKTD